MPRLVRKGAPRGPALRALVQAVVDGLPLRIRNQAQGFGRDPQPLSRGAVVLALLTVGVTFLRAIPCHDAAVRVAM